MFQKLVFIVSAVVTLAFCAHAQEILPAIPPGTTATPTPAAPPQVAIPTPVPTPAAVVTAATPAPQPYYPPPPPRTSIEIGHNVSATSQVMKRGQCTIGLQIVGCGITPKFTAAFSPWLLQDYQMYNIGGRYLLSEDAKGNRWAVQSNYFKTWTKRGTVKSEDGLYDKANGAYEMEALWLMGVRTWQLKPDYRLHLNFQTNYYFNEKMPFSLRRPYITKSPFQLNLTLLNEIDLINGWVLLGEVGLLDFARFPTHFHSGVSMGQRIGHISWHLGFSMSATWQALVSPTQRADYQQILRVYEVDGYNSPKSTYAVKYDFSIHPEFSLQYYF